LKSFADENAGKGRFLDLGCGPGQTTKFLSEAGVGDIIGTDLSEEMVKIAREINPLLSYETADMLSLHYPDHSFGAAIAFYSIVHFDYDQVRTALKEINRILTSSGQFLFSFHIGDHIVHLDNFLDHQVNIDFHFFELEKITAMFEETHFRVIDILVREPYKAFEYDSKRAYIWLEVVNR
jgi:ubiquinone/menaquinone biosynthesis C-methylase UbiE